MIKIKVMVDDKQLIQQIITTGHAGYADSGYDIVCAAVSSQLISVENSLHQLIQVPVQTEVNEVDGGYLKITLPTELTKKQTEQTQLLLSHLVFALEVIAESYPEFVKIQNSKFIP